MPVFNFANQSGLDMLETTLVALQDITLEKIFDENGRKNLSSQLPQIMQQVRFIFSKTRMWKSILQKDKREYRDNYYNFIHCNTEKYNRPITLSNL